MSIRLLTIGPRQKWSSEQYIGRCRGSRRGKIEKVKNVFVEGLWVVVLELPVTYGIRKWG